MSHSKILYETIINGYVLGNKQAFVINGLLMLMENFKKPRIGGLCANYVMKIKRSVVSQYLCRFSISVSRFNVDPVLCESLAITALKHHFHHAKKAMRRKLEIHSIRAQYLPPSRITDIPK